MNICAENSTIICTFQNAHIWAKQLNAQRTTIHFVIVHFQNGLTRRSFVEKFAEGETFASTAFLVANDAESRENVKFKEMAQNNLTFGKFCAYRKPATGPTWENSSLRSFSVVAEGMSLTKNYKKKTNGERTEKFHLICHSLPTTVRSGTFSLPAWLVDGSAG